MKIGMIKSSVDAHTLGIYTFRDLLAECEIEAVFAPDEVVKAAENLQSKTAKRILKTWIIEERLEKIGYSHRLDPEHAFDGFYQLFHFLKSNVFSEKSIRLKACLFAGLPEACERVQNAFPEVNVFSGDETPFETLQKIGVHAEKMPDWLNRDSKYDDSRWSYADELIRSEDYVSTSPNEDYPYPHFGTENDTLKERLVWAGEAGDVLLRAHVGPYHEDRETALATFESWLKQLRESRHLDILSIGSSQLTQEKFGEDWSGLDNGGGIPINNEQEFKNVAISARPMLVRAYSGTNEVPRYSKMLEDTLNTCWHALSIFWFNQIDNRGPLSVKDGVRQHLETIQRIASYGKPFEPNISHHFSFRGADDLTGIVATYLVLKLAQRAGVKHIVLQAMLNTPKVTSGIADIAKFRALLELLKPMNGSSFRVYLQPRAGLSYFSPNLEKAKRQLSASTMLMDDIEPEDHRSPEIIHVVSYSEAVALASPDVVIESAKIVRHTLNEYRKVKRELAAISPETENAIATRVRQLVSEARLMISHMEKHTDQLYSSQGLYEVFRKGYFPVPGLWTCREEFHNAVNWETRCKNGSMSLVNSSGDVMSIEERLEVIESFKGGENGK